jgi:hypothetical protein
MRDPADVVSSNIERLASRIDPWPRLRPALVMKLDRLRSDHLAHDLPGYPKLAANRLDRLLGEIRPTDRSSPLPASPTGPHVPMKATVDPQSPGSRLDADHPETGSLFHAYSHSPNARMSAMQGDAQQRDHELLNGKPVELAHKLRYRL